MSGVCPWCSADITEGATECPSCGANLVPDGDPNVPGVTAIDPAAILRSKPAAQPRGRLLSWISGEPSTADLPTRTDAQAVAPPDLEVRREILRLELEAEVANLQAEADALYAEAAAEAATEGLDGPRPNELRPTPDREATTEGAVAAAGSPATDRPADQSGPPGVEPTDASPPEDPPAT